MVEVTVEANGQVHSAEISGETYNELLDKARMRERPLQWFLWRIVTEYGELTEGTIKRFLKEKLLPFELRFTPIDLWES